MVWNVGASGLNGCLAIIEVYHMFGLGEKQPALGDRSSEGCGGGDDGSPR